MSLPDPDALYTLLTDLPMIVQVVYLRSYPKLGQSRTMVPIQQPTSLCLSAMENALAIYDDLLNANIPTLPDEVMHALLMLQNGASLCSQNWTRLMNKAFGLWSKTTANTVMIPIGYTRGNMRTICLTSGAPVSSSEVSSRRTLKTILKPSCLYCGRSHSCCSLLCVTGLTLYATRQM